MAYGGRTITYIAKAVEHAGKNAIMTTQRQCHHLLLLLHTVAQCRQSTISGVTVWGRL